ncbi:hypothetical protein [Cellulomonas sp. NPDC058312]|uniref:hypothetical protein n=1 Tax=Cellulomonas sp. NPDC058312 TaxID=3346441 RepID=UPI0036E98DD1
METQPTRDAEPTKPWWQMTRTPAPGFCLGALWLLLGVLRWWGLDPDRGWVEPTIAALFTLLGLGYLASAAATVRRRGATRPSSGG